MPGLPYRENILNGFVNLDKQSRDKLFAISCFTLNHWESGALDIEFDTIDRELDHQLENLLDSGQWGYIQKQGEEDYKNPFYDGDMVNRLLCSFLNHETRYHAEPETQTNQRQFDVKIYEQDIPYCEIGIKRLVSTGHMKDNLKEYKEKCEEISDADKNLFLNYYPTVSGESSGRIQALVSGYGPLSPHIDKFYKRQSVHVANIPAPIEPTETDFSPLEATVRVLREDLDM